MADPPSPAEMRFGKIDDIKSRVAAAIDGSRRYLFSTQNPEEGYWCGELGADTTLVSDYILLHRLLGTEDPVRTQKCANEILNRQNQDGGWPIYNEGPSNISASVKAYFALKMAGYSPDHPQLQKARQRILALGGVTEVNTFTKIYLCFLGQYDYDAVPAIPPEIVLFPKWFWFNLYEISSWSRAILVPLSIAYAKKPFKKIPAEEGIDELFVGGRTKSQLRLHWAPKL
ncbi:MAG TPA: prenyltransferase/squalene oxidase repeat-containing protein, partial [Terracidiphilus sp.]|nr:prenyltransferase/squalene oxidase repeat-containing protein [Terracidiphilus sp.]